MIIGKVLNVRAHDGKLCKNLIRYICVGLLAISRNVLNSDFVSTDNRFKTGCHSTHLHGNQSSAKNIFCVATCRIVLFDMGIRAVQIRLIFYWKPTNLTDGFTRRYRKMFEESMDGLYG